jgi:hypothetical protein
MEKEEDRVFIAQTQEKRKEKQFPKVHTHTHTHPIRETPLSVVKSKMPSL